MNLAMMAKPRKGSYFSVRDGRRFGGLKRCRDGEWYSFDDGRVMAVGKNSLGWVGFIVMGAVVVFLIYQLLDSAVTSDHQSQQIRNDKGAKQEMVALLRVSFVGKTREAVERFVGQVGGDVLVKNDGDRVEYGQVVFEFENGRCSKVFLMGEG